MQTYRGSVENCLKFLWRPTLDQYLKLVTIKKYTKSRFKVRLCHSWHEKCRHFLPPIQDELKCIKKKLKMYKVT